MPLRTAVDCFVFTYKKIKPIRDRQGDLQKLYRHMLYHRTALVVTASDAMMPAARTLAASVPIGSHLRDLCLPIPWPLSLAKYQRNQTPGGATEHPNQRTALSARLRTFIMANTMLRTHKKESKIDITAIRT
jgi:hypothetical protein